ncbi:MAG TPA: hypothetical protein VFS28_00910 [Gemmatimonadales bacterium]|jgi:hypothetical protein|nr:hypothetical protein [Gemmatimonadales bacterium]
MLMPPMSIQQMLPAMIVLVVPSLAICLMITAFALKRRGGER